MKFLFVIDNLSTGGAQRQMINLALGLKARGHAITFFTYAPGDLLGGSLVEGGIPVIKNLKKSRYSLGVILDLSKAIRNTRCDTVLSYLTTPNVYSLLASRLLFRHPHVVVSERFCDPPKGVNLLERCCRQTYRLADAVVVNSNHQRMNFANQYPWMRARLTTIYNGYNLDVFHPLKKRGEDGELKLLSIASISPYKNGLVVIQAMHELKVNYGISTRMDWIGQRVMTGERLDYLLQMEAAIKEYNLESRWHWLDQRSDIVDQMNSHDVLVHPSYGEGLPNVVCEALACGLPVIVSNTLDHPNLVQEGVNGYLFDQNDAHALAEKIKTFHELPADKRLALGERGRLFAEQNLSLKRFTDAYEAVFASQAS